jgi:SAM-dependent methyltransferase
MVPVATGVARRKRYGFCVAEPALWGLRRRLLDLGDRLHLARPAVQAYELALAARSALRPRPTADDTGTISLPPARLRAQAGPRHADARYFLDSGRHHAELIRSLLEQSGTSIEDLGSILDWGCGCGRIMRHWSGLPSTRVFGCDINPRMVEWCNRNLEFAEAALNDLDPPLPYEDSAFELVYALSVITHLPEDLQHVWVAECLRVLKPGGFLLFSTLGEFYLSLKRLSESERTSFSNGNVVVLYEGAPGTSLCSAYHPAEYVHQNLGAAFELVAFRPATDDGRHDMHLFRKPALSPATAERS